MKIYFSGIGGVGIGPLALISHEAGYEVLGSDREESLVTAEMKSADIRYSLDQSGTFLEKSHAKKQIDWFVYTSALPADHPELQRAKQLGIKTAKRDELLAYIIKEKSLKLIAVAGTHGKTSTTGMIAWILRQLGIPASYSIGTTLSFGPSGTYVPNSEYFIYECDEFDRNFLHFTPYLSIITNIDYDHPDTYPTKDDYFAAFKQFVQQSRNTIMWSDDAQAIGEAGNANVHSIQKKSHLDQIATIPTAGQHNRENTYLAFTALQDHLLAEPRNNAEAILQAIKTFPGTNRRFEKLAENLYSDYGHHPTEISATLQLASELSKKVALVYQPHQNQRQHEVIDLYTDDVFKHATKIYWLPTYLTREDSSQQVLTPTELTKNIQQEKLHFAELNDALRNTIETLGAQGFLVLGMGAGTIDSWLRNQAAKS